MKHLLIIFIVLSAVSCTKIIAESHPQTNLKEETKRNYYYKKGTYWIYRDSVSGRIDSCWVTSSRLDTFNANGMLIEWLHLYLKQFSTDPSHIDSSFYEMEIVAGDRMSFVFKKRFSLELVQIDNTIFGNLLPIETGKKTSYYEDSVEVSRIIPDFNVAGQVYKDVAEIYYRQTTNKLNDRTFYFSDSIGLVKMRINIERFSGNPNIPSSYNEVWELQRYHLEK